MLSVTGQTALQRPGETSHITVTATYSDGKTADVTADTTWIANSQPYQFATIVKGEVTAVQYGRGNFTAWYQGVGKPVPISVLPVGAYLITGTVVEGSFRVAGAKVDASSDLGVTTAVTDAAGWFAVAGLGSTVLRVERTGYVTATTQLTIDRDSTTSIDLRQTERADAITGMYRLTITASPSCSDNSAFPAEALKRIYDARITESGGGQLLVELSGGTFGGFWGWGFTGTRTGDAVTFELTANVVDDDWVCVERLGKYLIEHVGTANGSVESTRILATMKGTISLNDPNGMGWPVVTQCSAAGHTLEFQKIVTARAGVR